MSAPSKRGRRPVRVPSYRLHKFSGQAVVTIATNALFGNLQKRRPRRRYGQLLSGVAETAPLDPFTRGSDPQDPGLSIAELCLAFQNFAQTNYVKDGHQTDEVGCYCSLINVVSELFGLTPVALFGSESTADNW